jgi:membrane-associated phospholipid phosphatase
VLRHPERYARARTALAVMTAVAFVCFWLYPVAPPRLLPDSFGFVDTLRDGASGHLEGSLINTAGDQYASMPSLHVAWAVWCALALYPMFRHWALRALVVAYPVMTTFVVVATGNHYFLDAAAGTLVACLVWAVVSQAAAWTGGQRGPHPGDQDGDAQAERTEREVVVVGSGASGHGPEPDRRAGP